MYAETYAAQEWAEATGKPVQAVPTVAYMIPCSDDPGVYLLPPSEDPSGYWHGTRAHARSSRSGRSCGRARSSNRQEVLRLKAGTRTSGWDF